MYGKRILAGFAVTILLLVSVGCTKQELPPITVTTGKRTETTTASTVGTTTEATVSDATTTVSDTVETTVAEGGEVSVTVSAAVTAESTVVPTQSQTAVTTVAPTVAVTTTDVREIPDTPVQGTSAATAMAVPTQETIASTTSPTEVPTEAPTRAPTAPTQPTVAATTAAVLTNSTAYDKSWYEEYSKLYDPQESDFDDEAAAMRSKMKSLPDTLKPSGGGVAYYISNTGNDQNNGTSPATAFATIDPLRNGKLKAGDVVLFERGGIYRVTRSFYLVSGVGLGAYGTGDRPQIYGSNRNYADPSIWEHTGGNIWRLNVTFGAEVGNIVFDHGVQVGYWRETKAELTQNYDFWCNRSNGNITYVYMDKNPGEVFKSIEMVCDNLIFQGSNLQNVTLENLTIKYGMTALFCQVSSTNVTVRGCEMGFLGGAVLEGVTTNNFTTRAGGGVAFMSNSENALVENCWLYHIYDTGVTYQGEGIAKNFIMRDNLVEFCGMASFEYWGTEAQGSLIEGNLMRFAGCGFGGIQRPDKTLRAHIQSNGKPGGAGYNKAENFVIRNNVFDQSAYQLVNATSSANTPPIFDGNTYVQKNSRRRPLGYYKDVTQRYFDDNVADTIKNVLGDQNATVIYK